MSNKPITFTNREVLWRQLEQDAHKQWDMIIVGGGIIGAGVLREATRCGLKVLLVEQRDFAWGTSSRSSKMVHGGLRYIGQGDIKLTQHSLQERERLLKEAPGLVDRMGFYFLLHKGQFPGRFAMKSVLTLYDWLAGIKDNRYINKESITQTFPGIKQQDLNGACYFTDTAVDDARLVTRVLQEAIQCGGKVLNYVKAIKLIKTPSIEGGESEHVTGLIIENIENDEKIELKAAVIINATGAWADRLRNEVVDEKRIRPLRGSHLVLARKRLPVEATLALVHPLDKRPVFIFPWEGATLIGTTDIDHKGDLDNEASITPDEVEYLLQVVTHYFPEKKLDKEDVISSFAGVRPVIGSERNKDPSKERRTHAVWADQGLVTVTGGKLTTFRLCAIDALNAAQPWLKTVTASQHANGYIQSTGDRVFSQAPIPTDEHPVRNSWLKRMSGRYGYNTRHLLAYADKDEQTLIEETQFCLAECRWVAKHESVVHLDDLLLRRTRLGLLLKNGAQALFPSLEKICQQELNWGRSKWQSEVSRYQAIWKKHYSLPLE